MLGDPWRCLRDLERGRFQRVLEGFGKFQWGFRDGGEIWGRLEGFCRCSRGFEGLGGVLEISETFWGRCRVLEEERSFGGIGGVEKIREVLGRCWRVGEFGGGLKILEKFWIGWRDFGEVVRVLERF